MYFFILCFTSIECASIALSDAHSGNSLLWDQSFIMFYWYVKLIQIHLYVVYENKICENDLSFSGSWIMAAAHLDMLLRLELCYRADSVIGSPGTRCREHGSTIVAVGCRARSGLAKSPRGIESQVFDLPWWAIGVITGPAPLVELLHQSRQMLFNTSGGSMKSAESWALSQHYLTFTSFPQHCSTHLPSSIDHHKMQKWQSAQGHFQLAKVS